MHTFWDWICLKPGARIHVSLPCGFRGQHLVSALPPPRHISRKLDPRWVSWGVNQSSDTRWLGPLHQYTHPFILNIDNLSNKWPQCLCGPASSPICSVGITLTPTLRTLTLKWAKPVPCAAKACSGYLLPDRRQATLSVWPDSGDTAKSAAVGVSSVGRQPQETRGNASPYAGEHEWYFLGIWPSSFIRVLLRIFRKCTDAWNKCIFKWKISVRNFLWNRIAHSCSVHCPQHPPGLRLRVSILKSKWSFLRI